MTLYVIEYRRHHKGKYIWKPACTIFSNHTTYVWGKTQTLAVLSSYGQSIRATVRAVPYKRYTFDSRDILRIPKLKPIKLLKGVEHIKDCELGSNWLYCPACRQQTTA